MPAEFWLIALAVTAAWAGTALLSLAYPAPLTPERWRTDA